jgi:hypothetical protein
MSIIAAACAALPLFAGALTLQVDDLNSSPEALAKNAVVLAHITACRSPEKTIVAATAEGIADGRRHSIPLKVVSLSVPGAFAVTRQWPRQGRWTITMIATNPDYKDYATSVVVPVQKGVATPEAAKVFYHAPSADEVNSVLKQSTLE